MRTRQHAYKAYEVSYHCHAFRVTGFLLVFSARLVSTMTAPANKPMQSVPTTAYAMEAPSGDCLVRDVWCGVLMPAWCASLTVSVDEREARRGAADAAGEAVAREEKWWRGGRWGANRCDAQTQRRRHLETACSAADKEDALDRHSEILVPTR